MTVTTTRLYIQEVNQRLNQALASGVVGEDILLRDGEINQAALADIFHMLMVINPAIEVYLLDPQGAILAFSAPPGKVKRRSVSLVPLEAFLAGERSFPIRGDDPRGLERRKVFSAAPVTHNGHLEGYLYVVLGGEEYDSVVQMIQGSYILRLSAAVAMASLAVTLIIGFLSFNWLTRRLRRLIGAVGAFQQGDYAPLLGLSQWLRPTGGDEIDQLGRAIERMVRRIEQQIRHLSSADASRRELVASVSHDLRTPMTALQGSLETLLMKEETFTVEERRHSLQLAVRHGRRLERLIDELFELATLDGGGAALNVESFSLAELVQDVTQKFALEADRKGLRLETEMPENAPFVSGDIARIERVLQNLIENAIKYSSDGGTVRLTLIPGERKLTALVSDTGCGIAEADLPHVFDRFYRGEKSDGKGPEGTGLGLAIAKRILQLHGSPIEVESAVGEGTTFRFRLPLHGV
ncbi:MAG: HAMP domain-containing sensor histidine kinase [Chloroflexi bacterium]|nr:HAMP domain-containing sensor histidine kinase [Chloroflexota bacterium]